MLQRLSVINHVTLTGAGGLASRRARMSFAEFVLRVRAPLDVSEAVALARIAIALGMVRATVRAVPARYVAAFCKGEY